MNKVDSSSLSTFEPRYDKICFLNMRKHSGEDQMREYCAANQRFCFRYMDSVIHLLFKSKLSCLWLSFVSVGHLPPRTFAPSPMKNGIWGHLPPPPPKLTGEDICPQIQKRYWTFAPPIKVYNMYFCPLPIVNTQSMITKFGFDWPSCFRGDVWTCGRTKNDGRTPDMAIL